MRLLLAALLVISAVQTASSNSDRIYGGRSVTRSKGTVPKSRSVGAHSRTAQSAKCVPCERDANGKIKRNPAARKAFMAAHPCPANGKSASACPGYVVDHIIALKRGGADAPENMQWQTIAEAKAKDKIE